MPLYAFTQNYRSSYGDGALGDTVELSEADADAINRDAPGTLIPAVETRKVDAAPKDRMVRKASDRGGGGAMNTKDDAKAVKG